ncbi:uncharacterized protein N7469_010201 [Penicillium citrinum]|uniref:Uncharacterized protein n=1 Tax=Penicillium citrinum TaxID=5077 RepID=A0A9W9TGA7_PENCI|nr:uncharacterized protein N7469_010201 [Penicillium citrinum]KAJ5221314.1 hypothetical protein N7469_010201 [Penicillium citrinum]
MAGRRGNRTRHQTRNYWSDDASSDEAATETSPYIESSHYPGTTTRHYTDNIRELDPTGADYLDESMGSSSASASTNSPKRQRLSEGSSKSRSTNSSNPTDDWLPSDQIPRININYDELDLHRSYVGQVRPVTTPKPRIKKRGWKRKEWKHTGRYPITDHQNVPKGWTHVEHDLGPKYRSRCSNRKMSSANCRTHSARNLERRLKDFLEQKEIEDNIFKGWPAGLSREVCHRLTELSELERYLSTNEDKYQELSNVRALISAYKGGDLEWHEGLVTYWSHGKKLCEPRPLDWDEFEVINRKHKGHVGFWIALGEHELAHLEIPPGRVGGPRLHEYNIALRISGYDWWEELVFMHDTGASSMCITDRDIATISGPCRVPTYPEPPVLEKSPYSHRA